MRYLLSLLFPALFFHNKKYLGKSLIISLLLFFTSMQVQAVKHVPAEEPINEKKTSTQTPATNSQTSPQTSPQTSTKIIEAPKAILKSQSEINTGDLQYYLDEELRQLSDITKVLWLEYQSAQYKGVAILVPDWGRIASSASQIKALRSQLTHIGFTTITLQPPSVEQIKNKNTSAENILQDETEYQQTLMAQIQEVFDSSKEQLGFRLVISQGANSAYIADFFHRQLITQPDAMVCLDAYYPDLKTNELLSSTLAQLSFPLMDIHTRQANQWQKDQLQARARLMEKQIKLDYRQQSLLLDTQEQRLFKSIYGWMSSLGWY